MADSSSPRSYDQVIIDIKDYVFHYDVQSPKAWAYARLAVLDTLGCGIEGLKQSAGCRSLLGPVVPGTVVPDGFKLPGTSYQLDPLKGAFDFGAMIRYLDHNDGFVGADWGHPSDNTAAILAIMDWLSRSSASGTLVHTGPPLTMRTFLVAVIKAYEIQGCFLLRNAFNAVGIDHVMLVKVASTAVVSWLLGLSEEQTMAAISHAWMDVAPLRVYRSGSNTIPRKGWAAGDACMRAIHFALLVRRGQPGSPTPLTMPRWGFYATKWHKAEKFDLPKPYTSWVIENIFFKVMPVEGFCIAPVEAAVEQSRLLREKGLDMSKDIAKIEIRTNSAANTITNKSGKLHNAADRDHCMQYVVAVALLKGAAPDSTDYEDASEWASSAAIEELRNKTVVWVDDQLTQDQLNPDKKSLASGVIIHLANGEVLQEVLVEFPNGHVESALTLASVYEKFKRNMGLMFSDEEVKGIEDFVDGGGDKSISDFVDLLVRDEFGA